MIMQALRRIWAPELMVKEPQKLGDIPPAQKVYKKSLQIAGPSIVEFFLISLITMADTIMVSSLGSHAIAAVGITTQPRFIILSLVLAMNVGVTALTARRYGENDHLGAVACLKQALILCCVISVVVSSLAFIFCREFLLFAGAQPDTIDYAQAYFRILLWGMPLNCLSLTISAGLRGIGHTRAPMVINMTANLVNVCFNYFLIGGNFGFPRLEIRGAAIATVIGWAVGLLLALVTILHPHHYFCILHRSGWRFEKKTLWAIYRVASGAFLEQICMRIGFFIYNKLLASLGTVPYATHQILVNILSLSFSVGEGLSLAAASLVGQYMGAQRPDLSIVYGKSLQRISMLYGVVLMGFFSVFGRGLIGLFTTDPEILETGIELLAIAGIVILGQCSQMIFMGCLRGAGDTMYVAVLSMILIMIIRPSLAYVMVFPMGLGLYGGWITFLIDQYLRLLGTWMRFASGKWMKIKL